MVFYVATVLKGVFQVGMGEKFEATGLETVNLGNFGSIPKKTRHFALSKSATRRAGERHGPVRCELGQSRRRGAARRTEKENVGHAKTKFFT
jgi:hypothetical protein